MSSSFVWAYPSSSSGKACRGRDNGDDELLRLGVGLFVLAVLSASWMLSPYLHSYHAKQQAHMAWAPARITLPG